MARSLLGSLAIVAVIVVAAWFVLGLFGIHFALWSSLLISLALTAVLSLGMNAFRGGRTVHHHRRVERW